MTHSRLVSGLLAKGARSWKAQGLIACQVKVWTGDNPAHGRWRDAYVDPDGERFELGEAQARWIQESLHLPRARRRPAGRYMTVKTVDVGARSVHVSFIRVQGPGSSWLFPFEEDDHEQG